MSFSEAPFNIINRHKVITYDNTIKALVWTTLYKWGEGCDLNFIDTSHVRDMSSVFADITVKDFDISEWDTYNVVIMESMFSNSQFNGDISKWDTRNVLDMTEMFSESKFDGDISQWDVSKVRSMYNMFGDSEFNHDISGWKPISVDSMSYMFANSKFNKDISGWDVSHVRQFERMFSGNQYFNHNLSKWNPVSAINMTGMFEDSVYDKNLILWTTKMFNAETYKMFSNSNVPNEVIGMFHYGINIEKEKYSKNLISAI